MELRRKLFWVSVLYFAEGFPFGLVVDNLPVYFRTHGVSLTEIGLMSLLGAPWTLKVAWSPLVDRFGTRQRWIVGEPGRSSRWCWRCCRCFRRPSRASGCGACCCS